MKKNIEIYNLLIVIHLLLVEMDNYYSGATALRRFKIEWWSWSGVEHKIGGTEAESDVRSL